ncbi:MAG: N-acetylglucosamine-6-phosphate deacetylase [Paenibacillaceae bacterium]|nr:N-acetylglucosamine-6-phosphate deacetylase [Paenibacillaceae bacterium]
MSTKVIVNATIVTPTHLINKGKVWIENGMIADCGPEEAVLSPGHAEVIDAAGEYVAPGFIDIHCHGGGGYWAFQQPYEFAMSHLKFGTTGILATVSFLQSRDEIAQGLQKIIEERTRNLGSVIMGVHLEGPFINQKYGAITSPIRSVDPSEYIQYLRLAGDHIKLWTLAPELEGQQEFMDEASRYGIVFSVGHSEADAETILACVPKGLKVGCHCTNATGTTPSPSRFAGTREMGVDETVLVSDDIYAEVIPDKEGCHVRPLMLKLILKAKGADKVIIITDAADQAGMTEQASDIRLVRTNELSPVQGNDWMLAGSLLTMNQAVRNMRNHTGASWVDLFKMSSLNPAKLLGVDRQVGSVEKGKIANVLIVTENMDVRKVIFEGREIPLHR